jgi:hypothetical protein
MASRGKVKKGRKRKERGERKRGGERRWWWWWWETRPKARGWGLVK